MPERTATAFRRESSELRCPVSAEWVDETMLGLLAVFAFDYTNELNAHAFRRDAEHARLETRLQTLVGELTDVDGLLQKVRADCLRQIRENRDDAAQIAASATADLERRRRRLEGHDPPR